MGERVGRFLKAVIFGSGESDNDTAAIGSSRFQKILDAAAERAGQREHGGNGRLAEILAP